ncbi:E4 [Gammapapillomavirus 23]|uniref:E4 n=2 Tax=Papillomaviridae TaxID=151340 RepID=A0A2D2AM85_9PAPI|nr:E4 [Gammapapillomavirus 23]AYA94137.1 MAG: E4 protein [Human papillomavirus]
MDFIMRNQMGTEFIIFYSREMQQGMEKLDNGLCSLKIQLFLPLYLVHTGRNPPFLPKGPSVPPATPYLQRRASIPNIQDPTKAKRETLAAAPGPRRKLQFDNDDDDEKENQRPPPEKVPERRDDEEATHQWSVLGYLLQKWEADIEEFQRQVLQDLQDLKLKLGIH